jgi:excisionase family DNA binding protein
MASAAAEHYPPFASAGLSDSERKIYEPTSPAKSAASGSRHFSLDYRKGQSMPPESQPEPILLTARMAAAMLSVCERTIFNLAKNNTLPKVKVGGATRYRKADIERFAASQAIESA